MNLNRVYNRASLEEQGLLNDFIRAFQSARKYLKLNVSDKVNIVLTSHHKLQYLLMVYEATLRDKLNLESITYISCPDNKVKITIKYKTK